jgi:hypothetical protein
MSQENVDTLRWLYAEAKGNLWALRDIADPNSAAVWTLRNGIAERVRYYDEMGDALEAVGISE